MNKLVCEPADTAVTAVTEIAHLARRYGTPLYRYDLDELAPSYKALRHAVPEEVVVYYSLKANRHPDVLATMAGLGVRAEVSAIGEMNAAVAAGFNPAQILFTAPGKRMADLEHALSVGIRLVSADSPTDLDRIEQVAGSHGVTMQVLLRVNADQPVENIGLRMTGVATHLGSDASFVLSHPEKFASTKHARVQGVHLYMGTGLDVPATVAAQFKLSLALASEIEHALGVQLQLVDLGGGFGAPYASVGGRTDFAPVRAELEHALWQFDPDWRTRRTIIVESGRYLTAACGQFAATVLDVKTSKGHRYVVLDAGINTLNGLAGMRRVPQVAPLLTVRDKSLDELVPTTVTGPLCTPLDIWGRDVPMPVAVAAGDVVHIENVGAYGLAASLAAFHGHPLPVEVAVSNGQVVSATRWELDRRPVRAHAQTTSQQEAAWPASFDGILRQHLRFADRTAPIPPDVSLRLLGLDSLGAVELVNSLEDTFAIQLPEEALAAESFRSAATLWEVVAQATAAD
jgi:diaminopimelate decarboxylase